MFDTDTIVDTGNAGGFPEPFAILASTHDDCDAASLLDTMITSVFAGRIALVSSFGVEAAVLLDLVAGVDRDTPVIFNDTGKLFPETIAYRDHLIERLGLTNVRTIGPGAESVAS